MHLELGITVWEVSGILEARIAGMYVRLRDSKQHERHRKS